MKNTVKKVIMGLCISFVGICGVVTLDEFVKEIKPYANAIKIVYHLKQYDDKCEEVQATEQEEVKQEEVKQEDNKQQAEVTTLATSPVDNSTSIYDQRDEDRKTMNTNDNSTIGLEDKENYIYHNLVYDDELCNSIINSVFSNEAYGQKLKNALIEKHASLDVIYNEYGIPEVIFIIENKAYLVHAEDEYFVINKILDAENFNVDRTTNYVYLHY